MDVIQQKLINIFDIVPEAKFNRIVLRSTLSDLLPGQKLQVNTLMNAYDEGIVSRLSTEEDKTVISQNIVELLSRNYGITRGAAVWAVQTWCYILGYRMIGDQIASTPCSNEMQTPVPEKLPKEMTRKTTDTLRARNWRQFLLPGFRTGHLLKVIVALLAYSFWGLVLYFGFRSDPEIAMVFLITVLSIILFSGNYLGVQSHLPGTRSHSPFVRFITIIIYDFLIFVSEMIIWVIIRNVWMMLKK